MIENLIPSHICDRITAQIDEAIEKSLVNLVDHSGLGNQAVSDLGGRYYHHIFKGDDIRKYTPDLESIYHSILPLISMITVTDAIISPYPLSDINIKAYPAGGGTLGLHYDTNGITVLLSLITNNEAPLRAQLNRSHPSKKDAWVENVNIPAVKGNLLIMQGRKVLHDSAPTVFEKNIL